MLPTHAALGTPGAHTRFGNRCASRRRLMAFFSIAGITIGYLLFLRRTPPHSPPPPPPPPLMKPIPDILQPSQDPIWFNRTASVKEAFLHAYEGYEKYTSFPDDELRPLSNSGQQNFNGWGVTVVDSMDTMWLMGSFFFIQKTNTAYSISYLGLTSKFDNAIALVATLNFTMDQNDCAPFFETVIRYLGGLLSAYALSGEPILLARADELGRKLLPAFNSPSGLPYYCVNTATGKTQDPSSRVGHAVLAELASYQLEYKYLSYVTGKENYFQKAEDVVNLMRDGQLDNGLWNIMWDLNSGKQGYDYVGVGAAADSGYEYVLKQYLLSGKSETTLRDMFLTSTSGVIKNLLFLSPTRHLLYVSDFEHGQFTGKFEHLACFYPGLLALAASTLDLPESERQLYMWAAEGLGHSCWIMYADQESGLGPELVRMDTWPGGWKEWKWIDHVESWQRAGAPGGKPPGVGDLAPPVRSGKKDYDMAVGTYLSRPETLESTFILWRTTGDIKWREHGWAIWDAIEKKTRTSSGYASVQNVEQPDPDKLDSMPSYFLSETIKYAYLLALDEDPWPVDKFVFNTEAHPLPIFKWRDWEKQKYSII